MRRSHKLLIVVLLIALLAAPAYAQPTETDLLQEVVNFIRGVLEFLFSVVQGFFDWIAQLIVNAVNLVVNILKGIWDVINWIIGAIRTIIEFIFSLIEIFALIVVVVFTFIFKVAGWIFALFGIIIGMIQTYFGTTPMPIPGWPQCISAPTEHNLCAFWYVLDYTVFAPDTIGSIIPVMLIAITAIIVVIFVGRLIMQLVGRTQSAVSGG